MKQRRGRIFLNMCSIRTAKVFCIYCVFAIFTWNSSTIIRVSDYSNHVSLLLILILLLLFNIWSCVLCKIHNFNIFYLIHTNIYFDLMFFLFFSNKLTYISWFYIIYVILYISLVIKWKAAFWIFNPYTLYNRLSHCIAHFSHVVL